MRTWTHTKTSAYKNKERAGENTARKLKNFHKPHELHDSKNTLTVKLVYSKSKIVPKLPTFRKTYDSEEKPISLIRTPQKRRGK